MSDRLSETYRQNNLLDALPDLCDGLEVRFGPAMPDYIQALMATLGVKVIFDDADTTPYTNPNRSRRRRRPTSPSD